MPNFPTHRRRARESARRTFKISVLVGLFFLLLVDYSLESLLWVALAVCLGAFAVYVGVLIPDIDHHSSIPRRWFEIVIRTSIPLGLMAGVLLIIEGGVLEIPLLSGINDLYLLFVAGILSILIYLQAPMVINRLMPPHRGLLHRGWFWWMVGLSVAVAGLIIIDLIVGTELIFLLGLTGGAAVGTTFSISGLFLFPILMGGGLVLGAQQHLEQDGLLYKGYEPDTAVTVLSKIKARLRWLLDYLFASIEETMPVKLISDIGLQAITSFSTVGNAARVAIKKRSLQEFQRRLTLRDVAMIVLSTVIIVIAFYLLYRGLKRLQSQPHSDKQHDWLKDTPIRTFEGDNGALILRQDRIIIDRERWKSRYTAYGREEIHHEDLTGIITNDPGLISAGSVTILTEEIDPPKTRFHASYCPQTIKYREILNLEAWIDTAEAVSDWRRSLQTSHDELQYLASR